MLARLYASAVDPEVQRDLARAISAVENGGTTLERALDALAGRRPTSAAAPYVIGITGPPGAGKSTIVDRLIEQFRARDQTIAVIAVDPSSPFSKGAVLGDRIRMQRHAADGGVFIRSMASRGASGGLAPTTAQALRLVKRAGFDVVVIETVGVGQVELDVVSLADVVVLVTVPGLGDEVQTLKAGLTEIADVFVVNMAARPGANQTAADLRLMVRESGRDAPVLKTVAINGIGIEEVMEALDSKRP
jgi:LAO/AO transport system kinase